MGSQGAVQTTENLWRRRFPRLPVSLAVSGEAPEWSGQALRGTLCNVGAGGMMMELPVEMVPGSAMRAVLETRCGRMEVEGRVVWTCATGTRVRHGLAFPEPKDPDFALDLFLAENR
jgi:hypothetical protein